MKKLPQTLWRFSVATTLEAEDAVAELLGSAAGQAASSHFNVETRVSVVSVYGERKNLRSPELLAAVRNGLKQIKHCGLKLGTGKIVVNKVRRQDWKESWKRHFKPIVVGDALLVKPSWIKRKPRKGQTLVVLDPGLSFGTGQHPTTSFCLGQIAKHRGKAKSFLDLGTGSGILAIAAAKLGYSPVRALDFDPECVRTAQANARGNRVQNKLRIAPGDVAKLPFNPRRKYDLVCANLISNLLIAERRRIVAHVKPGGVLVLAGILKAEFSQVRRAFEGLGFKIITAKSEKEWRSGSFIRR